MFGYYCRIIWNVRHFVLSFKCASMCCNPFESCHSFWKKWKHFHLQYRDIHIHVKQTSDSMMLKVNCHFVCILCGGLRGLGGSGCSEPNHQVITVLCGPHRQQTRLRGSMICFWKSTPLKLKSILSERLPKDKVLCVCVCVHLTSVFDYVLHVSLHVINCPKFMFNYL